MGGGVNAQVGIGTTSPSNDLDVEGSGEAATAIDINNISTGDPKINFQLGGSSPTFSMGIDNSDADKFKIGTSALETNTRFTIDASGNVGLGTTSPLSTLDIQGSMGYKVSSITAATTLNATHNVLLCNNGPYTVTLPAANVNTGRVYKIKNIDPQGDVITIDANASETVDGALTFALQPYKHAVTIISDGANWHIIDDLFISVGSISTINCSGTDNGTLVNGVAASSVNSILSYTGGNAGTHNGQAVNSTGVTGLTATLSNGTFTSSTGNLTYTIAGTPTSSGTASFAINIGGQTCTLTRTVSAGAIASINCSGTDNGILSNGVAASSVNSILSYTGGNAGTHSGQSVTSTGVTGLTAALSLGTFASGSGTLTYNITGTPGSTGTASFAINIGGQTCTLTRTVGTVSSGGTAVVSTWTSTVGCSVGAGTNNSPAGVIRGAVNETMAQGVAAPVTASITLVANVTTAGTYTISTNTLNGVTFSATGTFGATGSQTVTLTPSGTPTAAGNFKWATVLTPSIDVYGSVITTSAPLGSSYTAHFNGITAEVSTNNLLATYTTGETFNSNTTCASKRISAQGCAGVSTVTDGVRTYNTVAINGQCWLQSSLITAPSVYSTYTTGSWTNIYPGDQGYWGYYHTTDGSGASGWQSTEPVANEGRLYQWCGAMDATISERSRGICPAGWHVPSDCEWMYLEHGQGMSIAQQTTDGGWRANAADNQGTPGYKLRSEGIGFTNASNFSGLLAGYRTTSGVFSSRSSYVLWWSSSATGAGATSRFLLTSLRGVARYSGRDKTDGESVRCLKD